MNRFKNNNLIFIIGFIFIFFLCVGIAYATLNKTLTINGISNIEKPSWDIQFENIKVKSGSVSAVLVHSVSNKTSLNFEVNLKVPGEFYEFTVDVKNNGTIDAMLEELIKLNELTEFQQKFLIYTIKYENEEQILKNQLLKPGEFLKLKIRVEFKRDITESDLPTSSETINLGFKVNYIQADENSISVPDNGAWIIKTNGFLDDIGTTVSIGPEQFYTIGTEGSNVKLLSMYNLYVGNGCTSSSYLSCSPYGSEATGLQDSTMKGKDFFDYNNYIRKGVLAFSTSNYWGNLSNDEYIYNSNSLLYNHVENYRFYLENIGADVVVARLIKVEDLDGLGCDDEDDYCSSSVQEFVYSTSYWTGSCWDGDYLWYVETYGGISSEGETYDYGNSFGVRPVIVMPKTNFVTVNGKKIIEITIDNEPYQAEEGMTWAEWEDSIYNTQNISIHPICGYYAGKNGRINLDDLIENLDVLTLKSPNICS